METKLLLLNLTKQTIKKTKEIRKILRKFRPNFQHYVKKTETQAKTVFLQKTCMPLQLQFYLITPTLQHNLLQYLLCLYSLQIPENIKKQ